MGLCVERSPEMVIGLLGILKAGGAYLPLDPHYPAERLAFMLSDAARAVLVGRPGCWRGCRATGAALVRLDADWPQIARSPSHAPALELEPQHPAYVIYTSGSTGTPKGVVVGHGRIVGSNAARSRSMPRCLDGASCCFRRSFDSSVAGTSEPLSGGTLVLSSRFGDEALSSIERDEVNSFLRCRRFTVRCSTLRRSAAALRTVVLAGEACPSQLAIGTVVFSGGPAGQCVWPDRVQRLVDCPR